MEDPEAEIFRVQFHPEVTHTVHGMTILRNFLFRIAGYRPDWTMGSFIEEEIRKIREMVGRGRVLCALAGA